MSLDTFEQSLLLELRRHVVAQTPVQPDRAVRRRWVAGGVAGLVTSGAAAVVISLGTGVAGPTAAYGVESQPNGDVIVTVHDLTDASGLERALAAEGVHADVRHVAGFTQSGGQKRAPSGGSGSACSIALAKIDGGLRFTLGAAEIAGGATLTIITSGSSPTDVGSPVAVAWSGGSC
jgi:hypothetical protein